MFFKYTIGLSLLDLSYISILVALKRNTACSTKSGNVGKSRHHTSIELARRGDIYDALTLPYVL